MNTETTVACHCSNKRKDDRSFIKENSRVKKEASEMRDFCRVEPNRVLTQYGVFLIGLCKPQAAALHSLFECFHLWKISYLTCRG